MVANVREEVNNLRHTNEDLLKQVEGLQMNRFSEVEELVYLRWVNACLRFELRNYQTPSGKISARDLSKSLSPRSQERAKQLMLEYAESERGGGDTDMESCFDNMSVDSEDFDNASVDSSLSRLSSLSKKPSLIQKLKRWGRSKDDSIMVSSPARSLAGESPSRSGISTRPRGPLESLMLRNAGDSMAITTFGMAEQDEINSPETPGVPPDSLNFMASSFHLMSKSVEGVLDEKYPAYKDRHKLAVEREKQLKEKAQQARTARFGGGDVNKSVSLPLKLSLVKEKPVVSGDSGDQPNDNEEDSPAVSRMKLAHIEKRAPRVPRPPPKASGEASTGGNKPVSSGPPGAPPPASPPPGAPPPRHRLVGLHAHLLLQEVSQEQVEVVTEFTKLLN